MSAADGLYEVRVGRADSGQVVDLVIQTAGLVQVETRRPAAETRLNVPGPMLRVSQLMGWGTKQKPPCRRTSSIVSSMRCRLGMGLST